MKKLSLILVALTIIASSCKKENSILNPGTSETTSFSMTYDGLTYTEAEANSLSLVGGNLSVNGTTGDGFVLIVSGIGSDGTTVNICPDPEVCDHICNLTLDFGAAVGLEGFVATSGTVKRTGNKIEISATGLGTTEYEAKDLTATIEVGTIIDF